MITSAAAVMVSVFAIFITLSMIEMKMMGVALAASILIDATLIRLVILPAALVLLGERAWWPGRVGRPRGEVVEAEPELVQRGLRPRTTSGVAARPAYRPGRVRRASLARSTGDTRRPTAAAGSRWSCAAARCS